MKNYFVLSKHEKRVREVMSIAVEDALPMAPLLKVCSALIKSREIGIHAIDNYGLSHFEDISEAELQPHTRQLVRKNFLISTRKCGATMYSVNLNYVRPV